jgi:hypothetical protein
MVKMDARAATSSFSIGRFAQGRQFGDPAVALLWLGLIDGEELTRWSSASMYLAMPGMNIVVIRPQS